MEIRNKFNLINNTCTKPMTVDKIAEIVKMPLSTLRRYLAIMHHYDVVDREDVMINDNGRPNIIFMKAAEITDETYKLMREDLRKFHSDNKANYYQKTRAEKPTSAISEALADKQVENGIYLMSSSPSKKYIDKYKAQTRQYRDERKSQRVYPGTTGDMVW